MMKTRLGRAVVLCLIACHAMASNAFRATADEPWRPASIPIQTRWAKDVTPENAWPEYPRPQMVRSKWVNLNGLWDYAIRPKDAEQPGGAVASGVADRSDWDGQILVPFAVQSALSGVGKPVTAEQKLWYRRTFATPRLAEGGRLLLHFGAVDWQATVWINGQMVGAHRGGYDPFTLDITSALNAKENTLVVAAWDPTDQAYQPRGKQVLKPRGIWYTAVTGIWQTVWLEPVPASYIQGIKIVPDIDHQRVVVTVTATDSGDVILQADGNGVTPAKASGNVGEPIELNVPQPRLWSPDQPFLYDLHVTLQRDGRSVDRIESYFGMRQIELAKDDQGVLRLTLNHKRLFQYGPLDQGWWPDGLYTAPTDEALKYDIVMTKKFGMNLARKHVKYEPARWYYWCDRLGLMVWQDMPSGNVGNSEESKINYRRELKAMIDALHSFPSIVVWVPFNEGWGQHDTADVAQWIKAYDPSRLVNEASGWSNEGSGDLSDMHKYPGPAVRPVESHRTVVLGEFGGLGLPVKGHTWLAEKSWGYRSFTTPQELTDAYVDLLAQLRPLIGQGLSAAVYTQTTDVEIEINGLMTYDRAVNKMDVERIAEAARKLYLPPPVVKTLVPTSEHDPQLWHYTFDTPDTNWQQPDFDDSGWKTGPAGFGSNGTPGAVVKTEWTTSDIWIRRSFPLDGLPADSELTLSVHHDEDAEVYFNGRLVKKLTGYSRDYGLTPLSAEAVAALRAGANTIAIHCHQSSGGQYIDAGLSLISD